MGKRGGGSRKESAVPMMELYPMACTSMIYVLHYGDMRGN